MQEHNNINEDNIFEALGKVLPLIQEILPMDAMLGVSDKEKFLYYLPGKDIKINVSPGDPVPSQSGLMKCQKAGEKISQIISKEVYGIPVKASTIPLRDKDGVIIGAFSLGLSIETQQTLHEAAQTIASTTEEINSTAQELASTATQLAEYLNSLRKSSENVISEIEKTDEILQFVKEVAKNSNLLGLNATIEAARAGEYGLGFVVVAEEIQEMSNKSAKAVKDIKNILLSIRNSVSNIAETLIETAQIGEHQAAATEEISASMEQLAESANNVEKISKLL